MDATPAIVPQFAPGTPPPVSGGEEEEGELAEPEESVYSRPSTPVGNNARNVFDATARGQLWDLAANFSDTSTLLLPLRKAGTSRGRIIALATER